MSCYPNLPQTPCTPDNGCPVNLDSLCIFYHKNTTDPSKLTGLGMPNGVTLEALLEALDVKIRPLNLTLHSLPALRQGHTINTLQDFTQSVDAEIGLLQTAVDGTTNTVVSLSATDSSTIDFTTSGTLGHTITGAVKVSQDSGNLLETHADGLYVTAPALNFGVVPEYADNATALAAGLPAGAPYRTGEFLKVVYIP